MFLMWGEGGPNVNDFQPKHLFSLHPVFSYEALTTNTRLLPNKHFKEPRRAKAKKLGAQQVMFWELLQNIRHPKEFLGCPRLLGSC